MQARRHSFCPQLRKGDSQERGDSKCDECCVVGTQVGHSHRAWEWKGETKVELKVWWQVYSSQQYRGGGGGWNKGRHERI